MLASTSNPTTSALTELRAQRLAETVHAFDLLPSSIDADATTLIHRLQTHFMVRRFGLATDRARLVASLAFVEVPR